MNLALAHFFNQRSLIKQGFIPSAHHFKSPVRRTAVSRSFLCTHEFLLFSLSFATIFILAGCSKEESAAQQRPAPEVTVMTVTPRDISYTPALSRRPKVRVWLTLSAVYRVFSIVSLTRKANW
ncbi:MAG: hypothetical protein IPP22_01125 [Nitrosomonas sp.]|nr:hypothetical protein [Nitrosomonas sp.]